MFKRKLKIFYLCDRKVCKNCHEHCLHTTNIKHALNFKKINNTFWEVENETNNCDSL